MELRFVLPHLAKLDEIDGEILVGSVFVDQRPARGVVGLADFRLGGRLSKLMRSGFVTGAFGEVVMIPGKPRLSFDKLLLFGAGEKRRFDEAAFTSLLRTILRAMQGLSARTGVVELPGRQEDVIPAARAADILLGETGGSDVHDMWTLIENLDGRASIEQHMVEQKRRFRRQL